MTGLTLPVRIQRQRTAGWRKPEGAVYVGRGSRYGNPFVGPNAVKAFTIWVDNSVTIQQMKWWTPISVHPSYYDSVDRYASEILGNWREELRGKDLMCWCILSRPCHADVLLELANGGGT